MPPLRSCPAALVLLAIISLEKATGAVSTLDIHVPFTTRHISINGDLSEWDSAASIEFRAPHERGERDNLTAVRLLWDHDKLYVAFSVRDTELRAALVEDDRDVWRDDAVEVLLDAKHDGAEVSRLSDEEYVRRGGDFDKFGDRIFKDDNDYQIIANLRSTVLTSRGSGLAHDNRTWDVDVPCAVAARGTLNDAADKDSGYVVELAVPWSAVGVRPGPGLVLGADFGVEDVDFDGRHPSDWCSLEYFLQPHLWGDIVLGGKGASRARFLVATSILALLALGCGAGLVVVVLLKRRTGKVPRPGPDARLEAIVVAVETQIRDSYASAELSTARVAGDLGLSERRLEIALKKAERPRFREMLNRYRIDRAADLLKSSDHNVAEVGYAVGYRRPDVFSAVFKKYKGVRPREFRRSS